MTLCSFSKAILVLVIFQLCAEIKAEKKQYTTPMVIGHRGDSAHAPENTIIAFQKALELGDGFETDLRFSKDGVVVLIHDEWVNRTTNGTGRVADMTLAELEALDAGSWFGPQFAGAKIPTLEEGLRLIQNLTDKAVVLDLKVEGLGKAVAEVAYSLGVADRVIASCWTDTQVENMREYLNSTAAQKLTRDVPLNFTGNYFAEKIRSGIQGFSIFYQSLSLDFVRESHLHLLPIFAWTMEGPDTISDALHLGVDGLIANDPGLCVEAILNTPTNTTVEVVKYEGMQATYVALISICTAIAGLVVGMIFMHFIDKRRQDNRSYSSLGRI